MIKLVLILNQKGKIRHIRLHDPSVSQVWNNAKCVSKGIAEESIEKLLVAEIFSKIKGRSLEDCSIIEDLDILAEGHKIIYRKYSTLFFIFLIDEGESELASLDLMSNLVDLLELNLPNLTEFELVMNPDKLFRIIDEVVIDGIVSEINLEELQKSVKLSLNN